MDYETVLEEQMDAMDLSELEDSLADAAQQSGVLKDLSVEDLVDRLLNGQAILDSDQILENLKNLFLLEVKSSLMLGCEILAVAVIYKITPIAAEPVASKNISDSLSELGSAAITMTVVLSIGALMFLIFIAIIMGMGGGGQWS